MHNRLKKIAVGGTTVAFLGMAAMGGHAFAQDNATPTPSSGSAATTEQAADQAAYQGFIDGLATNLGNTDSATVDAAIRTTLKQMVDAEFAAGNISANDATAEKAAIGAATGPELFDIIEHHGESGHGGNQDGGHGHGNKPGSDTN